MQCIVYVETLDCCSQAEAEGLIEVDSGHAAHASSHEKSLNASAHAPSIPWISHGRQKGELVFHGTAFPKGVARKKRANYLLAGAMPVSGDKAERIDRATRLPYFVSRHGIMGVFVGGIAFQRSVHAVCGR